MKLNLIADALRMHPRTVLRAITLTKSPYWAYDYDPDVRVADVAAAFGCPYQALLNVIKYARPLYTQAEAARMCGIPLRTFRHRSYHPFIKKGSRIERYREEEICAAMERR